MGSFEALVEEGVEHRHGDEDRMKIKTKTLFTTELQDDKKPKGRIDKCESCDRVENSKRNGETGDEETEPNQGNQDGERENDRTQPECDV